MPTATPRPANQHIAGLMQQGIAYADAGNLFFANQCFAEVTRLEPTHADGWHMQALVASQEKKFDHAIQLFQHTLKIKPNFAEAHNNLGNVFKEAGRFAEAVESYRKAVRLRPDNAIFHSNLGSGLHQMGEFDAAKKAFGKSIHLNPQGADAWCNLAVIHSILGEKEEKNKACEKTLELRPSYGQAFHMLAQDHTWKDKGERFSQMEKFLEDAALPLEDRIHIGFALGKISEDMGEYDTAFRFFARANDLKRRTVSLDIHHSQVQIGEMIGFFTQEWIEKNAAHGHKDARPVFIVGLPRSGTTLIEQILDRHSAIHGGGELLHISQIIRGLERDTHRRYPHAMGVAPEPVYAQMGAYYMKQVESLAPKATYITDKMPGNFAHVGFIKTILPQAKIIWCRRDYRDNAVSIFKRQFGGFVPYAYDLYEIGRMTDLCERMRAHWLEILGKDDILEVVYEDVVKDVEKQAKRLINFLGLDWEAECLEFHASKRAVTTASYEQVRRPIYDSSVGIAQHYKKHLAALEAGMTAYKDIPLL